MLLPLALFARRHSSPPPAAPRATRAALCRHATLAAVECEVCALEAALAGGEDPALRARLAVACAVRRRLRGA